MLDPIDRQSRPNDRYRGPDKRHVGINHDRDSHHGATGDHSTDSRESQEPISGGLPRLGTDQCVGPVPYVDDGPKLPTATPT